MSWANNVLRAFGRGVHRGLVLIGRQIAENVHGALFAVGVALLLAGVRAWSPPAAHVVAGVIAMAIGVAPYVLKLKRGRS